MPENNLRVNPGNERSPSDKPPPAEAARRDRCFCVRLEIVANGYEIVVARIIIFGQGAIKPLRVTPVMEAGISDHVWSIEAIVGLLGAK
jgi:hypothetical protein